jgi:hypothetical protein
MLRQIKGSVCDFPKKLLPIFLSPRGRERHLVADPHAKMHKGVCFGRGEEMSRSRMV